MLLLLTLIALFHAAIANPQLDGVEAPTIDYGHWISQGPATEPHPGQLTVVELWATWCGPCHETFPELTRLQAEYGGSIRIVALTDDRPERVRKFFHEHRDQMRFAIAVTDSETVQSLMFGGFGGRALPSVYVMRDGRMLWSGHPDQLDAQLRALADTRVAEGWQVRGLQLPAGGTANLVLSLAVPDGFEVQPQSVDLQVLDAGSLQVGQPAVMLQSQAPGSPRPRSVIAKIGVGAGDIAGVDTTIAVEIGYHLCQEDLCFPRQTEVVEAVVHVSTAGG